MRNSKNSKTALRLWQAGLFLGFLAFWHLATSPTLLPPIYFDNPDKAAMQKAKDDFRKKNANYKKLLGEAKDLSRKADEIARANPEKIKPTS